MVLIQPDGEEEEAVAATVCVWTRPGGKYELTNG